MAPHGLRGGRTGIRVLKLEQTIGDPPQERAEEGVLRSFSMGGGGPEAGGGERSRRSPATWPVPRRVDNGVRAGGYKLGSCHARAGEARGPVGALEGPCPGLLHAQGAAGSDELQTLPTHTVSFHRGPC